MSTKITPEQSQNAKLKPEANQSDSISSNLHENKNFENFEELSINKLFKIYLAEVSDINKLQKLVELYGLEYNKRKKLID